VSGAAAAAAAAPRALLPVMHLTAFSELCPFRLFWRLAGRLLRSFHRRFVRDDQMLDDSEKTKRRIGLKDFSRRPSAQIKNASGGFSSSRKPASGLLVSSSPKNRGGLSSSPKPASGLLVSSSKKH